MKKELLIGSLSCVVVISLLVFRVFKYQGELLKNPIIPAASAVPAAKTSYSLAEVQLHQTEADCWQTIDGKVYDLTGFISQHPGGKNIINFCGQDSSQAFAMIKNGRGHSANAVQLLPNYYLGILK